MRVCYFGTYRSNYSRNQMMIEGLRQVGVDVIECHRPLWRGFEDRVAIVNGGWKKPAFSWRVIRTYSGLLGEFFKLKDYDVMIVGYPGYIDIFVAYVLSLIKKKPLIWDVFNSLYLMMTERRVGTTSPLMVKFVKHLERFAFRLPSRLILDNEVFIEWFQRIYNINVERFRTVPIGGDNRYFYPILGRKKQDKFFRVVYYGTYIPNHGVEYIIGAAQLLQDDPEIRFVMIGKGPDREKAQNLVLQANLRNVEFIDWVDWTELAQYIAQMDVVLGAFGISEQLLLTNNNKIYEAFAMYKPVVSSKSPAMPAVLQHGIHMYMCDRGNSISLAEAIRTLKKDPVFCQEIAKQGNKIFKEYFDLKHIGIRLLEIIQETL